MSNARPLVLESVDSLWAIWSNEAHDFTPWLAENLNALGEVVGLELEFQKREKHLGGPWGRADILAQQAESNASVIIENQLGRSDNDHFVRLLGYATASEADIVIWVAGSFERTHREMLEWLNRSDAIQFYAVAVKGWRIGESEGVSFERVVAPQLAAVEAAPGRPRNLTTICADFYRPLSQRLRREAAIDMIGRGGFRGRYRTYHTGLKEFNAAYATALRSSARNLVALRISGEHYGILYDRVLDLRPELERKVPADELYWPEKNQDAGYSWLGVSQPATTLEDLEDENAAERTRDWMFDRLATIRDVFQPRLDEIGAHLRQSTEALETQS